MADYNIVIAMDTSQVQAGADVVQNNMQSIENSAETANTSIGNWSSSIESAIGPLTALAGIMATAFAVANIDQLKTELVLLADVVGVAVPEFQKFVAAVQSVGFNAQDASDALRDVNDRVGDFLATGGGEFVDTFEQILEPLGVTKEELKELGALGVLQTVSAGMEKLGFTTEKTTFFMESLASDSTFLLPILKNNNKELKRMSELLEQRGLILTDEEVKALREANTQISDLSATIENAFVKATGILATNIDTVISSLQTLTMIFGVRLAQIAIPAAITAIRAFGIALIANPIGAVVTALVVVISTLIGFADQIKFGASEIISLRDIAIATFQEIRERVKGVGNFFIDIWGEISEFFSSTSDSIADSFKNTFGDMELSLGSLAIGYAKILDSIIGFFIGAGRVIVIAWSEIPTKLLSLFVEMFNTLSILFTGWLNWTIDKINELSDELGTPLLDHLEALKIPSIDAADDIGTSMMEAMGQSITDSTHVEDAFNAIGDWSADFIDKVKQRALVLARDSLKINIEVDLGPKEPIKITPVEILTEDISKAGNIIDNFFKGVDEGLDKVLKNATDMAKQTEDLLVNAFKGAEDAIVDFVTTGKLDFKSLANSIIADLARIAVKQAIMAPLTQALGSILPSVFAPAAAPGPGIITLARGGLVSGPGGPQSDLIPAQLSNGEYVVNAAAASMFMPLLDAINSGQTSKLVSNAAPSIPVRQRSGTSASGETTIQIFDQRTGTESPPVQTSEQTDTDGRRVIQVLIRDTVKREVDNGMLDSSLRHRYGLARSTTRRG